MTERLHPQAASSRTARGRTRRPARVWGARTIPPVTARELAAEGEPTLFGLPAEIVTDDDTAERSAAEVGAGVLRDDVGLVVVRRADRMGAGALVLAGAAANVSLSLSWAPGGGPTGLSLVQRGVEELGLGTGEWRLDGGWQPFAVVLGGGVLVLLGFLLLIPARGHRFVGVLALVVTLAAAMSLVLLTAVGGWGPDQFGPGMWCAVAVPVLGGLGALKAMLTAPLVTVAPAASVPE